MLIDLNEHPLIKDPLEFKFGKKTYKMPALTAVKTREVIELERERKSATPEEDEVLLNKQLSLITSEKESDFVKIPYFLKVQLLLKYGSITMGDEVKEKAKNS